MTVRDLREGMKCSILSVKKNSKFETPTIIRSVEGNIVLIDATLVNETVVNRTSASNFLLIDMEDSKPQNFAYIVPVIVKKDGKHYYRIDLKGKKSVTYNRRHNYRMYVGKPVHARADGEASTSLCILKNLSAVGFALVFAIHDLPKNYKDIKKWSFVYKDEDPKLGISFTAELNGVVRRIVPTESGKMLIGCQIPFSPKVDRYVNEKEAKKERNASGLRRVVPNVRK